MRVILLPLTVSASLIFPSQDLISDFGDIVSARHWAPQRISTDINTIHPSVRTRFAYRMASSSLLPQVTLAE
jgi:hypothetical protein